MHGLIVKEPTIDSREVADMVGKQHSNLCRDIAHYIDVIGKNSKLNSSNFFRKTTYKQENNGKEVTRYDVTRKGCEMIANKLTGEKGILFTAAYVERFHQMEDALPPKQMKQVASSEEARKKLEIQEMRAKAMLINANTRMAKVAAELAKSTTLPSYKNALIATATNTLAGEKVVELPKSESGRKRHELGWFCKMAGRKPTWAVQMSKELTKLGIAKEDGKTGDFVETIDKGGHQRQNFEWYEDYLLPIVVERFGKKE